MKSFILSRGCVLLCAGALTLWAQGASISVKLGSTTDLPVTEEKVGLLGYEVRADRWNRTATVGSATLTTASFADAIIDSDGNTVEGFNLQVASRGGTWQTGGTTDSLAGKLTYRYLDDGAVSPVKLSATVPYENYSLILYYGSDSGSAFAAPVVNGTTYTASNGVTLPGSASWGSNSATRETNGVLTFKNGSNCIMITGLSGDLSVAGTWTTGTRTTLCAFQIIEQVGIPNIESININFGGADAKYSVTGSTLYGAPGVEVAGDRWNNLTMAGNNITITREELMTNTGASRPVSATLTTSTMWNSGAPDGTLMKGYADDGGSGTRVVIEDLPYSVYDVYLIIASDQTGGNHGVFTTKSISVNGTSYRGEGTATVEGTANWSAECWTTDAWVEGKNYLKVRVNATAYDPLEIQLQPGGDGARAPLAAIQIVGFDLPRSMFYTRTVAGGSEAWETPWVLGAYTGEPWPETPETAVGMLTATADSTLALSADTPLSLLLTRGSGALSLVGPGGFTLTAPSSIDFSLLPSSTISAPISGDELNLQASGTGETATSATHLSGANTFGALNLLSGFLTADSVIGDAALTIKNAGIVATEAENTISAPIMLAGSTTFRTLADTELTLSGAFSGSGSLVKKGTGTLTITGPGGTAGALTTGEGLLVVDAPMTFSTITVWPAVGTLQILKDTTFTSRNENNVNPIPNYGVAEGATLTLNRLGMTGTSTIDYSTGSLALSRFIMGDNGSAVSTFNQSGGTITVTTTNNGAAFGKGGAMMTSHWTAAKSYYNLTGGTLSIPNGALEIGGDFKTSDTLFAEDNLININGGTLIARCISGDGSANIPESGVLRLASGSLILGNLGINTLARLEFIGGTIGTLDSDWAIANRGGAALLTGEITLDPADRTVTFNRALSGEGTLTVATTNVTPGTLKLAVANPDFTGTFAAETGTLLLANLNAAASAAIELESGGSLVTAARTTVYNIGALTAKEGSKIAILLGSGVDNSAGYAAAGAVTLEDGALVELTFTEPAFAGSYTLITGSAENPVVLGDVQLELIFPEGIDSTPNVTVSVKDGSLIATVGGVVVAKSLAWDADSGTWDSQTLNWVIVDDGTPASFNPMDAVSFPTRPGAVTITLNEAFGLSGFVVNAASDYTFTGTGSLSGAVNLVKNGTGSARFDLLTTLPGISVNEGSLTIGTALGVTEPTDTPAYTGALHVETGATLTFDTPEGITQKITSLRSGSGDIIKEGPGTLQFPDKNAGGSFTGTLTVNAGMLRAGSAQGTNTGVFRQLTDLIINAGGSLLTDNHEGLSGQKITVNGGFLEINKYITSSTGLTLNNGGTIYISGNSQWDTRSLHLSGAMTSSGLLENLIYWPVGSQADTSANGIVLASGNSITVDDPAGTLRVRASLYGGSALNKRGPGTLILETPYMNTAGINLEAGTLALGTAGIATANSAPYASGSLTLASGTTLVLGVSADRQNISAIAVKTLTIAEDAIIAFATLPDLTTEGTPILFWTGDDEPAIEKIRTIVPNWCLEKDTDLKAYRLKIYVPLYIYLY